ncbi:DUF4352 domain-containing protein [Brevibacterium samyangense]|uniref:DUF4352 domain-containing protein n=1 Tax=Brevibacterium samyangense TaxID=366888 RepID=A0ABN2T9F7_9MICO
MQQHPGSPVQPDGSTPPPAPYGYQQAPGPQAHGHPAPGGYPPAAPPKKKSLFRRGWFWVLAVGVVIVLGSCAGALGDDADSAADASASSVAGSDASSDAGTAGDGGVEPVAEEPAEEPAEAGPVALGDTGATGDWDVTVNGVETGVATIGDDFLSEDAQGQYVLVDLAVTNTGDSASLFMTNDAQLVDTEGRTYEADSSASLYLGDEGASLLDEVNPGNTLEGVVAFDVPEGIELSHLEFSGGLFAESARFALS